MLQELSYAATSSESSGDEQLHPYPSWFTPACLYLHPRLYLPGQSHKTLWQLSPLKSPNAEGGWFCCAENPRDFSNPISRADNPLHQSKGVVGIPYLGLAPRRELPGPCPGCPAGPTGRAGTRDLPRSPPPPLSRALLLHSAFRTH